MMFWSYVSLLVLLLCIGEVNERSISLHNQVASFQRSAVLFLCVSLFPTAYPSNQLRPISDFLSSLITRAGPVAQRKAYLMKIYRRTNCGPHFSLSNAGFFVYSSFISHVLWCSRSAFMFPRLRRRNVERVVFWILNTDNHMNHKEQIQKEEIGKWRKKQWRRCSLTSCPRLHNPNQSCETLAWSPRLSKCKKHLIVLCQVT